VYNKVDVRRTPANELQKNAVQVSAKTGEGIPRLIEAVQHALGIDRCGMVSSAERTAVREGSPPDAAVNNPMPVLQSKSGSLKNRTDAVFYAPALGSERQKKACVESLDSVRHALGAAEAGFTLDAAVSDIEDALYFLGEITGAVTPEDILDTVFSQFCVGK
jgi:tRNA U34 5-carboxymethylaminomethyl modifying GTPase MnmE/TrmE